MENLIKSDVFDRGHSTFLIDVLKSDRDVEFIRLRQTVHDGPRAGAYTIEFDQVVLDRIRSLLEAPESKVLAQPVRTSRTQRLTGNDRTNIVRWYLKNVTAKDLAVQFGCKPTDIEQVLREEGIVVLPPEAPKPKRKYRGRRY